MSFQLKEKHKPVILYGKWVIKDRYMDPGDGSGAFELVKFNKYIVFNKNGIVESNLNLCDLSHDLSSNSKGVFSKSKKIIVLNNCKDDTLNFDIKNSRLEIYYNCFEGCIERYVKVK